jgi:steroid delta-isomerase-like uncharacterized protein
MTDLPLEPAAVVRGLWDAINDRDYTRVADSIAAKCSWVSIGSGRTVVGPEAMVLGLLKFAEAFPDGRGEILNLIVSGETVVVEWVVRGTNAGPYDGRPPTGRKFARRGCSVAEVRGGKIVGYRDYFDRQTLTEQLGLV